MGGKLFLLRVQSTLCSRYTEPAFKHPQRPKRRRKAGGREGIKGWGGKKQLAWCRVAGKRGSRHAEGSPPPPPRRGGLSPRPYHSAFLQGAKPLGGSSTPSSQWSTAPGHCRAGKAWEGAWGPPRAVPSRAAISLPPSFRLRKGRRGLAAGGARWERRQGRRAAGKARARPDGER